MSFVSAGGAAAHTPASISGAAAAAAFSASAAAGASSDEPRGGTRASSSRIESASRPSHNLADPPVFPTSLAAVRALTRDGGFKKSQWSDPGKYSAQLVSTKIIIANNVYCVQDEALVEKRLLDPREPLPPPPKRTFEEEPPVLIMAVSCDEVKCLHACPGGATCAHSLHLFSFCRLLL
jgi:hypothetical protein